MKIELFVTPGFLVRYSGNKSIKELSNKPHTYLEHFCTVIGKDISFSKQSKNTKQDLEFVTYKKFIQMNKKAGKE